ncbi:MAG: HNH endonuclease signature motif containing protein [Phormidesmis sp.]
MSQYISAALRQMVKQRAGNRCEYCLIHQTFSVYNHEIDHVIATKHGGQTKQENLVLSCLPCNRHKGSDLTSIDPKMEEITPLFNPRTHPWEKHFKLKENTIIGLSATGRTTVFLLQFNEPSRLQLRQALIAKNLYPKLI